MDSDLIFLIGLGFLPLAFVAFVSAWADRRRPWAALVLTAMGGGMAGWAWLTHPEGGYDLTDLPMLALEVLARLLN